MPAGSKPKIFVIYYSTYGHVHTVAQAITKGLLKTNKVDAELYQIAETLPTEVLEKMHAAPKTTVPVITPEKLTEADGFLFGFPTRFGVAPAQVKAFFDATGQLWSTGALLGKPAGLFFSTGSQHGGQESTAFTFLTHFAHHGIVYVPLGYANPKMFGNEVVTGGSAWGAGTVAGPDGSRQPSAVELEIAETQGEKFADVAVKLFGGSSGEAQKEAEKAGEAPVAAAAAAPAPAAAPVEEAKPAAVPAAPAATAPVAKTDPVAPATAPAAPSAANPAQKKSGKLAGFFAKLKKAFSS
ncbi:flavodoxin-like fold protein [Coemansia sp. RSA 1721]|nr:flavodoxin-like fold protein [Coemansia sp. RSA 1721]